MQKYGIVRNLWNSLNYNCSYHNRKIMLRCIAMIRSLVINFQYNVPSFIFISIRLFVISLIN
jgi:hypothetical protein